MDYVNSQPLITILKMISYPVDQEKLLYLAPSAQQFGALDIGFESFDAIDLISQHQQHNNLICTNLHQYEDLSFRYKTRKRFVVNKLTATILAFQASFLTRIHVFGVVAHSKKFILVLISVQSYVMYVIYGIPCGCKYVLHRK